MQGKALMPEEVWRVGLAVPYDACCLDIMINNMLFVLNRLLLRTINYMSFLARNTWKNPQKNNFATGTKAKASFINWGKKESRWELWPTLEK